MNNDDVQQLKQYKINGDLFMNVARFQEAIQEYDKAISFNPSDPDTYLMKGDILSSLSMDEEAITEYHNARLVNLHNDDANYQQIIQDMISHRITYHNVLEMTQNITNDIEPSVTPLGDNANEHFDH